MMTRWSLPERFGVELYADFHGAMEVAMTGVLVVDVDGVGYLGV